MLHCISEGSSSNSGKTCKSAKLCNAFGFDSTGKSIEYDIQFFNGIGFDFTIMLE
jgi:hypothetical protein